MASGVYQPDQHGRSCFRPHIPSPPRLDDVADVLVRAIDAMTAFDIAMAGLPHKGMVGRLFTRLDVVHSSAAEGSTTTFTDLLEYESALKTAPDPDDAAIVSAAAQAFDAMVSSDERDPVGMACAVHRRLFERNRDPLVAQAAGRLKSRVNGTADEDIPGGYFYFTAPTGTPDAMAEWSGLTADADPKLPELVRQALSHWMLEHIHPFHDGNGRVGRLIVPLMLKAKGATRTACGFFGEAVHEDKRLYVEALRSGRISGDLASWARLFLGFLERAAKANSERLARLHAIEADWKQKTTTFRSDSVIHPLVSWALTRPAFTISDAVRKIGGTFASVNTAAAQLVKLGILTLAREARRDRLFQAPEVLDIFDRFRAEG